MVDFDSATELYIDGQSDIEVVSDFEPFDGSAALALVGGGDFAIFVTEVVFGAASTIFTLTGLGDNTVVGAPPAIIPFDGDAALALVGGGDFRVITPGPPPPVDDEAPLIEPGG